MPMPPAATGFSRIARNARPTREFMIRCLMTRNSATITIMKIRNRKLLSSSKPKMLISGIRLTPAMALVNSARDSTM